MLLAIASCALVSLGIAFVCGGGPHFVHVKTVNHSVTGVNSFLGCSNKHSLGQLLLHFVPHMFLVSELLNVPKESCAKIVQSSGEFTMNTVLGREHHVAGGMEELEAFVILSRQLPSWCKRQTARPEVKVKKRFCLLEVVASTCRKTP